MLFQARRTIE